MSTIHIPSTADRMEGLCHFFDNLFIHDWINIKITMTDVATTVAKKNSSNRK